MTHSSPENADTRCVEGRENLLLISHEIKEARKAYLDGMGQFGSAERKAKLVQVLFDDATTIADTLEHFATTLKYSATDEDGIRAQQSPSSLYSYPNNEYDSAVAEVSALRATVSLMRGMLANAQQTASPENALEWMERSAAPLHAALKKYPNAFEALHFLFNEMNHGVRAQSTPQPRWRHLKRGTEYTEIGRGFAQCAWAPIEEMTAVVIYRGHDGSLWVRNAVEFDDGRFEAISPALTLPERQVDPTRPACGQGDEWGRKPTEKGYGHD
jgi:hypothetical protein